MWFSFYYCVIYNKGQYFPCAATFTLNHRIVFIWLKQHSKEISNKRRRESFLSTATFFFNLNNKKCKSYIDFENWVCEVFLENEAKYFFPLKNTTLPTTWYNAKKFVIILNKYGILHKKKLPMPRLIPWIIWIQHHRWLADPWQVVGIFQFSSFKLSYHSWQIWRLIVTIKIFGQNFVKWRFLVLKWWFFVLLKNKPNIVFLLWITK